MSWIKSKRPEGLENLEMIAGKHPNQKEQRINKSVPWKMQLKAAFNGFSTSLIIGEGKSQAPVLAFNE